jgi:DNA transformation protein
MTIQHMNEFRGRAKRTTMTRMDSDFLIDLFATFGPVTIRRMFSGFGISVDGVTFALALREAVFLRAAPTDTPRFEAEGSAPFQYQTRVKTVTVGSYWRLPERLYDDPDELAGWARAALAAAERAALAKAARVKRSKPAASKRATKQAVKKTTTKKPPKASVITRARTAKGDR